MATVQKQPAIKIYASRHTNTHQPVSGEQKHAANMSSDMSNLRKGCSHAAVEVVGVVAVGPPHTDLPAPLQIK